MVVNFNSIKVRLEHLLVKLPLLLMLNFNSIKVRLELISIFGVLLLLQHFNSIKVRLERSHAFLNIFGFPLFQFHKGTIRTC